MQKKVITNQFIGFILLISFLLYIFPRQILYIPLLFSITFVAVMHYVKKYDAKLLKRLLNVSIVFLVLFVVIYSQLYLRAESWDGHLWYIRNVRALINSWRLYVTHFAYPPYLIELFLAFFQRLGGIKLASFVLAVFGIIDGYLCYLLFKKLNLPKNTALLFTGLIVTSPFYVALALIDFKIDLVFFALFLFSVLYWLNHKENLTFKHAFITGVLMGLTVLGKMIVIPFFATMLIIELLKNTSFDYRRKLFVVGTSLSFVVALWIIVFGINLPWSSINIYTFGQKPVLQLTYDKKDLGKCIADQKASDAGPYGPFYKNPYNFIFAPDKFQSYSYNGIMTFNPGFAFYILIWLFIPVYLWVRPKFDKSTASLFIAAFVYALFFMLNQGPFYWYLLCVFPFILVIVFQKSPIKFINVFVQVLIVMQLFYALTYLVNLYFLYNYRGPYFSRLSTFATNMAVQLNHTNGYILDASAFPEQSFLGYVDNYDRRVIRDGLLFGYARDSFDELHAKFINAGVKYIVVTAKERPYVKLTGCAEQSMELSRQFVRQYGTKIYDFGYNDIVGVEIYKLNESN